MLFDPVYFRKIRRVILYLAVIVVSLTLQNTVLNHIAPLGVRCMFMPAVTATIGMLEGGVTGCALGIFAGAVCDAAFFGSGVLFTVTLPIVGFFSGVAGEFFVNRSAPACCLTALAALAVVAFLQALTAWLAMDARFAAVMVTAGLQTAWSVPFIIPVWFACKGVYGVGR